MMLGFTYFRSDTLELTWDVRGPVAVGLGVGTVLEAEGPAAAGAFR